LACMCKGRAWRGPERGVCPSRALPEDVCDQRKGRREPGLDRMRCASSFRRMGRMRKKAQLPQKTCASCGRPFALRRKWAKVWDEVRYCSDRCRAARRSGAGIGQKD